MALLRITKAEFKRKHGGGELLLLDAPRLPLDEVAALLSKKLAEGVNLRDYAKPTAKADVDGANVAIYRDEAEGLIFTEHKAADDWARWSSHKPPTFTVMYLEASR